MDRERIRQSKAKKLELTRLVDSTEKPVRTIRRIPASSRETNQHVGTSSQTGEESRPQTTDPGGNSQPRETSRGNAVKVVELDKSLPRFGPLCGVDDPSVHTSKEKSWEHVLEKSSQSPPEEAEVKQIYLKAMRKVEPEAKKLYAGKASVGMGSDFRWMMIKDGCLFLQLAFFLLGGGEQLGYPSNDPIFGKKQSKEDHIEWIEAMFYVGNQIPLVVLKELMKQNFFQEIIIKEKWDPNPLSLCKKVLYEVLVSPALERNRRLSLKERMFVRNKEHSNTQPSDILHGLQNLVIGPVPPSCNNDDQSDDAIYLEVNEAETGNQERTFPNANDDGGAGMTSPSDRFLNAIGLSSAIEDSHRAFPSATELNQAGIRIRKLKSGRARSIHFKSYYFWSFLYLPAFPVDDSMDIIFESLKMYEMLHQPEEHRREVGSYLRLMSDIVQTADDSKRLAKMGIILGNSNDVENLPRRLSKLSSEDVRLAPELQALRHKIRDYSSPLIHYKNILNFVVFLAAVQTFFTVLAYFRPPKA